MGFHPIPQSSPDQPPSSACCSRFTAVEQQCSQFSFSLLLSGEGILPGKGDPTGNKEIPPRIRTQQEPLALP